MVKGKKYPMQLKLNDARAARGKKPKSKGCSTEAEEPLKQHWQSIILVTWERRMQPPTFGMLRRYGFPGYA